MKVLELAPGAPAPQPADSDDADLISRIIGKDQQALRTAYDEHAAAVMGVAVAVVRDRDLAQDVVQEVYVRLWDRPGRFDPGRGSLKSFLRMDAHSRALDLVRSMRARERRDRADHARTTSTAMPDTEDVALEKVVSSRVQAALAELPEDQRRPIALAYLGGFSYHDVATQLGLPEGTVKSRIRAGFRRLRLGLAAETV